MEVETFIYSKIKHRSEKIKVVDDMFYREFQTTDKWKQTCCFHKIDPLKQCYNFQILGTTYCKRHKGGVENEKISTTKIGDEVEKHVYELLLQCSDLINVKITGQENSSLDIIFQVKGEDKYRGIQVKKLLVSPEKSYKIGSINIYDDDTIIVGVCIEMGYYCIFNKTLIGISTFCFNPGNVNPKYRPFCFWSLEDNSLGYRFLDLLNGWSKSSTLYSSDCFSANNLKEKLMYDSFKRKCQELNLRVSSESTSDSLTDCVVNDNLNCQMKFSNRIQGNLFSFIIAKMENNITLPYSENDGINYFIFSYIDPNNEFIFYIIPLKVMINYGYVSTLTSAGKAGIALSPVNNSVDHWTKKFINRFDLFTNEFDLNEMIDLNDIFYKFQNICQKKLITIERNIDLLNFKHFYVKDKLCKYSESDTKDGNCYLFMINAYTSDNVPDYFIYRLRLYPDNFWIIPKEKLIEENIIKLGVKGTSRIYIPVPGQVNKGRPWLSCYLDNYSELMKLCSI